MSNLGELLVYRKARELVRHVAHIRYDFGDGKDQLRRAALSVVTNIAEGAGNTSDKQQVRYYGIARASANEVSALLDVLARIPHGGSSRKVVACCQSRASRPRRTGA